MSVDHIALVGVAEVLPVVGVDGANRLHVRDDPLTQRTQCAEVALSGRGALDAARHDAAIAPHGVPVVAVDVAGAVVAAHGVTSVTAVAAAGAVSRETTRPVSTTARP